MSGFCHSTHHHVLQTTKIAGLFRAFNHLQLHGPSLWQNRKAYHWFNTLLLPPPTPEFDTSLFLSLFNKLCLNVLSAPMLLGARFRDVPWIPDNHPRSDCFFHANKQELRGILSNRNLRPRPRPRPSLFQNKFLGDFPSAKNSIGFVST